MEGRRFDDIGRAFAADSSRRTFVRRAGAAVMGAVLVLLGRNRGEAITCREDGRTCREHSNCCSEFCDEKSSTGRRLCACPPERTCGPKCCDPGEFCFCVPDFACGCVSLDEQVGTQHSLSAIWRALTEADALAPSVRVSGFAPVVGRRFQLQAAPRGGMDGLIDCEVVEVDAPRRLVFTWRTGAMPAPATAVLAIDETEHSPRVSINRLVGDPASCDIATALFGRNRRAAMFNDLLPKYLDRVSPE